MGEFQPMYHHGKGSYADAASDAAKYARNKIEEMIAAGSGKALKVIEKVQTEIPVDRIVKDVKMAFDYESGIGLMVQHDGLGHQEQIHNNALQQILSTIGMPKVYFDTLVSRGPWANDLISKNVNELFSHSEGRHLLRSHGTQLRGFLSDKYRRLDSRPLIEAFADSCNAVGAIPVEGYALDTKVAIKAMMPVVYEPVKNEIVAFGLQWENSDYGNGAHSIRSFLVRLWCTNFAIADTEIRQVHLGRRLSEEISYSQKTYELDSAATASAIRDVVSHSLGEKQINLFLNGIKTAHEEQIDPRKAIENLKKRLTKGEVEQVIEAFNMPDIENLPPGNSRWRLSNALSWIAGQTEDRERALELEREAGRMIPELANAA